MTTQEALEKIKKESDAAKAAVTQATQRCQELLFEMDTPLPMCCEEEFVYAQKAVEEVEKMKCARRIVTAEN